MLADSTLTSQSQFLTLLKKWALFKPFPNRHILHSSKLKEFADDNFFIDENSRKFSRWVENTVGKGEIAHYEQFLLFPQFFQKTSTVDT